MAGILTEMRKCYKANGWFTDWRDLVLHLVRNTFSNIYGEYQSNGLAKKDFEISLFSFVSV